VTNAVGNSPQRFYGVMLVETALSRPLIESIVLSNSTATVTWSAVYGQKYRLQHKQNLTDANWIDVVPDVTATGPTATGTNYVGSSPQRFYRVFVVP
jgi:hypothetical protein